MWQAHRMHTCTSHTLANMKIEMKISLCQNRILYFDIGAIKQQKKNNKKKNPICCFDTC